MHEFAGRWDRRFERFGTALFTDDPRVVVAEVATSCALGVGSENATPDTASFHEPRSAACDCDDRPAGGPVGPR